MIYGAPYVQFLTPLYYNGAAFVNNESESVHFAMKSPK